MSNLWKALRDVSRDVDPSVGFEPAAPGSREDTRPVPPFSQPADAVPETAGEADAPEPQVPVREVPPLPGGPRRPPVATRRPATGPKSAAAKERLAQLQAPLRRPAPVAADGHAPVPGPGASGSGSGNPSDDNKIVRPPQFKLAGVADDTAPADPATLSKLRQALSAAARPGPAGDVPPGFEDDVPRPPAGPRPAAPRVTSVAGNTMAPRQAPAPGYGAPPGPGAAPGYGQGTGPGQGPGTRPAQGPGTRQGPPPRQASSPDQGPGTRPGPGPGPAPRPGPATYPAPDAARSAPAPATAERPQAGSAPYDPSADLPAALRPFAPGAPAAPVDVTAMIGAPRWHPGDDDVVPTDGRKGPSRLRLRERLGF